MSLVSSKSTENTVFCRFTPPRSDITRKHLEEIFSSLPIKKSSMIRNNHNVGLGYGFCKFTSPQDAQLAAREYNQKCVTVEGRRYTLTVELASLKQSEENNKARKSSDKSSSSRSTVQTQENDMVEDDNKDKDKNDDDNELVLLQTKKKTSRVIVRNLSFYATEREIHTILEKEFGKILELHLPRVDSKLHRGFCFVTFANVRDAQRAVQPRTTPLLIHKRPVAIDYAVSKHVHQQQKKNVKETARNEQDDSDDSGNDDDSSTSSDADDEEKEQAQEASENDDDDSSTESSDDDDDDDSSDDDASMESERSHPVVGDETKPPSAQQQQQVVDDDAVQEQKSLFVRNLPFDATRHDLFQLFRKFGHVQSIYLVKDTKTGVQKGTAFVSFSSTRSAQQALEAAGSSSGFGTQLSTASTTNGLYLRERRLFVNIAVDKKTAASLTVEKQGNQVTGKDRRNLYLKMEGRVANEADGNSSTSNAWEHLPESDQLKRQRAFAEKNTKLRSPLFFINSQRLSVRNLAKHVDEADFKKLCVVATKRGLDTNLVSQEDQVAHWRASGEMTTRDIMKRIEQAKEESADGSVIPVFDEKNVKRYIPSVYIDRDFTTNKKEKAPSRGFGFVDFEHHAHALACLRELNNNPYYTAEFVSGGKKAVDAKRVARKRKGKGEAVKGDFVSEDGRVLTPRLIVDFTVENKAKAKKQAEHRAQQQANIEKQRIEQKEKKLAQGPSKKQKKKSRGAAQRERKRRQRESGETQDVSVPTTKVVTKMQKQSTQGERETTTKQKIKPVKPPKKKRRVDEEEQNFENLVDTYRKAFSGVSELKEGADIDVKVHNRPKKKERRWFE